MSKPIKFFYDLMSQPSRAIYIILKLSGTPFEDNAISIRKGEQKTLKYKREINKYQKVPCIIDDGFKLSESIAILRYLSAKNQISKNLYPSDVINQARVDEYLEWQHTNIRTAGFRYFHFRFIRPLMTGRTSDLDEIHSSAKFLTENLEIFETVWLKETKFVAGNCLTAADIYAACEIEQPLMCGFDLLEDRPKLKEWMARVKLETNPYYDEAHKTINRIGSIWTIFSSFIKLQNNLTSVISSWLKSAERKSKL